MEILSPNYFLEF
jgi:pyruvate dehydrogenase E2 component (dihydrolipoamide acetyltransferase)